MVLNSLVLLTMMAHSGPVVMPNSSTVASERNNSIEADLDSDGKPDQAYFQYENEQGTATLIVHFGNGSTARLMSDMDDGNNPSMSLSIRSGGDARCADWEKSKTCGKTFELHHGPALVVTRTGERNLIFFWESGTRFFLEIGHR